VFASPGYADATMRDRIANFFSTLGLRLLIVVLPLVFVWARHTGARALAPLALVVSLVINAALWVPMNVDGQWAALSRTANTASLDAYLHSSAFRPGATYRVLRGSDDGKLGLYHVLRAGGRLDSEMFPESMAIRNFSDTQEYARLLCARHVDYVVAYASYTASHGTNELAVLSQLAAHPLASVRILPIEQGRGQVVYRVMRPGCPAGLHSFGRQVRGSPS